MRPLGISNKLLYAVTHRQCRNLWIILCVKDRIEIETSSPKGNDRSPENQQVQSLDKVFFFENLIKIEDAGVPTTLKIDVSNIQGQLTPQSRVESGSNLNSSKMLWLSLFLSRMKKIRSKLKALERPHHKIWIFQTLKGS